MERSKHPDQAGLIGRCENPRNQPAPSQPGVDGTRRLNVSVQLPRDLDRVFADTRNVVIYPFGLHAISSMAR
jgi:hypothetical protein